MLFSKRKTKNQLISPVSGIIKSIDQVNDEAISQKMLGDGFAINPNKQDIYSPITGTIQFVFNSKHAIGIKNEQFEIMLHVGIDTVELKGQGFECFVEANQQVKQGDLLLRVDFDSIKDKVPSIDVIVLLTDGKLCKVNHENSVVNELQEGIVTLTDG